MNRPLCLVIERLRREQGATLAEYSFILALVMVASALAVGAIGSTVAGFFTDFLDSFE
ncbi:MAG: Flp family type IVb pilin [Dehalococcoidia bacterium]